MFGRNHRIQLRRAGASRNGPDLRIVIARHGFRWTRRAPAQVQDADIAEDYVATSYNNVHS